MPVSPADHNRSLQAAQIELQRQQAADNLRKGLERRADRDDLVSRKYYLLAPHTRMLTAQRQYHPRF